MGKCNCRCTVKRLHRHPTSAHRGFLRPCPGCVRRIQRRAPEPPDRDAWQDRRENLWGEQFGLFEDPACEISSGDTEAFQVFPGNANWHTPPSPSRNNYHPPAPPTLRTHPHSSGCPSLYHKLSLGTKALLSSSSPLIRSRRNSNRRGQLPLTVATTFSRHDSRRTQLSKYSTCLATNPLRQIAFAISSNNSQYCA